MAQDRISSGCVRLRSTVPLKSRAILLLFGVCVLSYINICATSALKQKWVELNTEVV